MTEQEIKEACENKSVIVNSWGKEITIETIGHDRIFLKRFHDGVRYDISVSNRLLKKWTLKPTKKKYWLWKFKDEVSSNLEVTENFYNDEYKTTAGKVWRVFENAYYKEKLLYTEHEE